MLVRLTIEELDFAVSVGLDRFYENIEQGRRDRRGKDETASHIKGACGECAFAKGIGAIWTPRPFAERRTHPDVEPDWEVRTTTDLREPTLCVRLSDDFLKRRFALVLMRGHRLMAEEYEILGWVPGNEVEVRGARMALDQPICAGGWLIHRRDLRPIREVLGGR